MVTNGNQKELFACAHVVCVCVCVCVCLFVCVCVRERDAERLGSG